MSFDPNDPRFTAYLLSELSDGEREALESETVGDPAAKAFLAELATTASLLTASFEAEAEGAALPAAARASLVGDLTSSGSAWRFGPRAWVAAAAVLLLSCGVAFLQPWESSARASDADCARATRETASTPESERELRRSGKELTERLAAEGRRPIEEILRRRGVLSKNGAAEAVEGANPSNTSSSGLPIDGRSGSSRNPPTTPLVLTVSPEAHGGSLNALTFDTAMVPVESTGTMVDRLGVDLDAYKEPGTVSSPEYTLSYGVTLSRADDGSEHVLRSILEQLERTEVADRAVEFSLVDAMTKLGSDPSTKVVEESEALATSGTSALRSPEERYRFWYEPRTAESYGALVENPFHKPVERPLSTFGIDVDTASYSNVRRFLRANQRPPKDSVRVEEMINAFDYGYAQPNETHPIGVSLEQAQAPWRLDHLLVRVGLKAKTIPLLERPKANLVFLIDVSGSMSDENKLPLVKRSLRLMLDKLTEDDRVAIVTYAGEAGVALESTSAASKETITQAIESLGANGSTNGGAGITQAYDIAAKHFIPGGANRVLIATDGDFNVGITQKGGLLELIQEKAKTGVFLSVLGFGMGNLKDDTLEMLANKGNGHYAYIDGLKEAKRVLVDQIGATLVNVAKDVKVQVEFNPERVQAYRLIGYENRLMPAKDFKDDQKDGGEMGSGHTVTALYEIIPVGAPTSEDAIPLKYQSPVGATEPSSRDLLTVKVRYKAPEGSESTAFEVALEDSGERSFDAATADFRFASMVAAFGMVLRGSRYVAPLSPGAVLEIAQGALGEDTSGSRAEFLDLVRSAMRLCGEN